MVMILNQTASAAKTSAATPSAALPRSRLALLGALALEAEALRDRCDAAGLDEAAFHANILVVELRREALRHATGPAGWADPPGRREEPGAEPPGRLRGLVQGWLRRGS